MYKKAGLSGDVLFNSSEGRNSAVVSKSFRERVARELRDAPIAA